MQILDEVIDELGPLLRMDIFRCRDDDGETYDSNTICPRGRPDIPGASLNGINIRFIDAQHIPCTAHDPRFVGCADAIVGIHPASDGRFAFYLDDGEVSVAMRQTSRDLRQVLTHELLHVMAGLAHAEDGIMATVETGTPTDALTDMDKAQLWLYSNPLIYSGMPLSLVEALVRYGEWEDPMP